MGVAGRAVTYQSSTARAPCSCTLAYVIPAGSAGHAECPRLAARRTAGARTPRRPSGWAQRTPCRCPCICWARETCSRRRLPRRIPRLSISTLNCAGRGESFLCPCRTCCFRVEVCSGVHRPQCLAMMTGRKQDDRHDLPVNNIRMYEHG